MTGEPSLLGHPEATRMPSVSVLPGGAYDFFAPVVPTNGSPSTWPPPAQPASRSWVPDRGESGLSVPTAWVVTAVALVLSFGLGRLAKTLIDPTEQIDNNLRLVLVLTLAFYVLLGGALAWFCLQGRVGLTWVRGHAVEAMLLGLPLGAIGGALAVAVNSGVAGHLKSDPNVELLVGGGGALRVGLTLIVTAVLAPLVEETLFRGVLAGTLLAKGVAPAMWGSAIAFSIWHMNPTSLRYYVFMGLLLATLWRKRGLVASMSAHAAFNGVLTLAAVAATTGAGHVTQLGQLSITLPGGWHQVQSNALPGRMLVQGPAGAALIGLTYANGTPLTADQLLTRLALSEQSTPGRAVVAGSERTVRLAVGDAVEADIRTGGQPGHLLELSVGGSIYELVVVTGGSPAAERDWQRLVRSVATTAG